MINTICTSSIDRSISSNLCPNAASDLQTYKSLTFFFVHKSSASKAIPSKVGHTSLLDGFSPFVKSIGANFSKGISKDLSLRDLLCDVITWGPVRGFQLLSLEAGTVEGLLGLGCRSGFSKLGGVLAALFVNSPN